MEGIGHAVAVGTQAILAVVFWLLVIRQRIHELDNPRDRAKIRGRHIALRNCEIEFSLDRQH